MIDFAPYAMRPELALPDAWARWAGDVLAGHAASPPQGPPFSQVSAALAKHGLLPLLYHHLRDSRGWPGLPADMRADLADAFHTSAARSFLIEGELRRIGATNPGLAVLKGAALGHTLYANPALRPVSDLDLLCEPARVPAVQAQLAALGYHGIGLTAHRRLGRLARRYRAELPLIANVPGLGRLLVELHWSMAELPHYVELIHPAALLEGAQPLAALPAYRAPSPAVLLAYGAGHLALHHSRDLRLIWLVDLDRLVCSDAVDWDDLLRITGAWKLGLALYEGLRAAHRWLGTPLDPRRMAVLEALAHDPVAVRSWGLGDEAPERAWQRSRAALAALPLRSAAGYAAWLVMRAALRPLERRYIAAETLALERGRAIRG